MLHIKPRVGQSARYLCLFLWLGLFAPAAGLANDFTPATVLKVYDGDTIEVAIQDGPRKEIVEKVRLIGIDCPESWENEKFYRDMNREKSLSREEMLEFGGKAGEFAESLCPVGSKVLLEFGQEKRDKYGRMLAYVHLPRPDRNWSMLNAELLKAGLARTMIIPPNDNYKDDFKKLEREAREDRLGIWSK